MHIRNGKISGTVLGYDPQGILTMWLTIVMDEDEGAKSECQCFFGGRNYGHALDMVSSPDGLEFVRRVFNTVGIDKWEKLVGQSVRIAIDENGVVRMIGHHDQNVWYDPDAKKIVDTNQNRQRHYQPKRSWIARLFGEKTR
jgi:hypothetical protein